MGDDVAEVIIIGGGLAGLCCGRRLTECGVPFRILEAGDAVGGRVRTDRVDGFTLDRGFQIYLTGYPEGRRVLDLDALNLQPFTRGALVRLNGEFHRSADPRDGLVGGMKSAFAPVGSFADKLRVARLKWAVERGTPEAQAAKDDRPTLDFLRWSGFTPAMIDRFFRPFFGGVFLETELVTSSRFFRFVFRAFAAGVGAVPAAGMRAIPDQIAAKLPAGSISLNTPVTHAEFGEVRLATGEVLHPRAVVIATAGPAAAALTKDVPDPGSNGTVTLYYAAGSSPVGEGIIVLNGDGRGPINNLAVMSDAAPAYAPAGKSLVAVSVVGIPTEDDGVLDGRVRTQLEEWYGDAVNAWRLLAAYRIPHALPDQTAGKLDPWRRPVRLRPGFYVCGDHRDNASIDGAMTSGHRAAEAVAEDLSAKRI